MKPRHATSRRGLLLGAGALGLPLGARAALPFVATLLVPGPDEGPQARLARRFAVAIGRHPSAAIQLEINILGGPDGVTAANRFATEAAPDGQTLLAFCGAAAQSRLTGDQRAKFEPAGWLPVCASVIGAVVAGREPLAAAGGQGPRRLALGPADAAGTAALLGLDLLGLAAAPLVGLSPQEAEAAFRQGGVDAILLQGTELPARLAELGAVPWFVLDSAPGGRDPSLPDVPALPELLSSAPRALALAGRAAGTAARLVNALVLPALTPAEDVTLWRAAAQRWVEEENRGLAGSGRGRPLPGADATAALAALAPPPEAVAAYREWLLRRLNWQAG